MTSPNLERLASTGELKAEQFARTEFDGLMQRAGRLLADAARTELSLEARFNLAYEASHALASVALRLSGYRSSSRYLVFQCLEHTAGLNPAQSRFFSLCHRRRNLAEYEGKVDIEEALVEDLRRATQDLFERVSRLPLP